MTTSDTPPVADLPTDCEPIVPPTPTPDPSLPSSSTSTPPSAPPAGQGPTAALLALLQRLQRMPAGQTISRSAAAADAGITHLSRCFATPAGTDAVLLFVGYTAKALAVALGTAGERLAPSAEAVVVGVGRLPDRTVLVTSAAAGSVVVSPRRLSAALALLSTSARLRALSGAISDFRTFSRLWGLLGLYAWLRRLVVTRSRSALAWTQLVACIAFQALENWAFLADKGVLDPPRKAWGGSAKGLYRWSARFWAVHVALELGRLGAEGIARNRAIVARRAQRAAQTLPPRSALAGEKVRDTAERTAESAVLGAAEGATAAEERAESAAMVAPEVDEAQHAAWRDAWGRALTRNLAWFPFTLQGSFEGGIGLTEGRAGLLGSIPGVMGMVELWRQTAVEGRK